MKYSPIILLFLCLFAACTAGKKIEAPVQSTATVPYLGLFILQDGVTTAINLPTDEIYLNRQPFTLLFNGMEYKAETNKFHSVQTAALDTEEQAALTHEGAVCFDIPYFMPGTGLAADAAYPTLTVSSEAHHYITWETNGEQRATLLGKKDNLLQLSWHIQSVTYNDAETPVRDMPLNTIYLSLLNDFNLNKTMDKGEFAVITLRFK